MTYLKIYRSGLKLCESVLQEGVDLEEHSRSVRRAVSGRLPACPASTRFSFDSLPIFGLFDYFHLSLFLITCHQIDGRREVGASDRRRWDLCIALCACQLSIVRVNLLVNCQLSWSWSMWLSICLSKYLSACLSIIRSMWIIERLKMETKVGRGEPGGELFKQDKEKKSRGEHLLHGGHLQWGGSSILVTDWDSLKRLGILILLLQKVGNLDPIATKVWESGSICYKRLGARRRFVQLPQSVSSQHTPQRWSEYEITESVEDDTKFLLSLLSPRYDLYDCDLDNAMAAPGSMFAPAYWAETTPTIELELGQLFPEQRYAQSCSLGCVFALRELHSYTL